jgi:hypothetical protein
VVVRETHPGVPHPIVYAVFHVRDIKLSINFSCFKIALPPSHNLGFFAGCDPKNGRGTLEDCPDLANSLMNTGEFVCT